MEPAMRLVLTAVCAATLLAAVLPAHSQGRPRSETLDLEDSERALVAKEGLRQRRDQKNEQRKAGGSKTGTSSDCGKVDIGNDDNNKASSRIAERQKTVIVTGNVINTANCR
jgi:hypothetical protein